MSLQEEDTELLSVGKVSLQTGISADTLRVWERRYGAPVPVRLPSGHRRYRPEQVRWLRRISEAIALGHRPGRLIAMDPSALEALIARANRADQELIDRGPEWERFVRGLDTDALRGELEALAGKESPLEFLRLTIAPLLRSIGRMWSEETIDVRHEHAASEVIGDVLRGLRGRMETEPTWPGIVLASLPGEEHGIGIQMIAILAAHGKIPVHVLGPNLPVDEILRAAMDKGAFAVGLSASLSSSGVATDQATSELRSRLPGEVQLLLGGDGARKSRRPLPGVEYPRGLLGFSLWVRAQAERLAANEPPGSMQPR